MTRVIRTALAIALALATVATALAGAEVVQKGNVRINVSGSLSPKTLPRGGKAPITVAVGGKISTTDKSAPPKLKEISIELNQSGEIDTKGLPVCPYDAIQPASTSRARSACKSALVGQGTFSAEISLTGQNRTRPRAHSWPSTAARMASPSSTGRSTHRGPSRPRS